jgi:hypothetical protein
MATFLMKNRIGGIIFVLFVSATVLIAGPISAQTEGDAMPKLKDVVKGQNDPSSGERFFKGMVYIRMSDITFENLNALMDAGAILRHISDRYQTVTAFVDSSNIEKVKQVEGVLNVSRAHRPSLNQ